MNAIQLVVFLTSVIGSARWMIPTDGFLISSRTIHLPPASHFIHPTTTYTGGRTRQYPPIIGPTRGATTVPEQLPTPQQDIPSPEDVFSLMDTDHDGYVGEMELKDILAKLDIDASSAEVHALFLLMHGQEEGQIAYEEFVDWYATAVGDASARTNVVVDAILSRRTVHQFDPDPVEEDVFRTAIAAAIAAPNHRMTEPWRFIRLGENTIRQIAALNASRSTTATTNPEIVREQRERWERIPGWCVVTSARCDADPVLDRENYAATCCAVHNFCLAMHAEGVGTKWTTGPVTRMREFLDLCGIDPEREDVVGCLWYGFAKGGLEHLEAPRRKKDVDDVLSYLP